MAESTTLARPYAKAAFNAALSDKKTDEWSKQLALAATLVQDNDLFLLIKHPGLTAEQKGQLVLDIAKGKISGPAENFVKVLATNKRLLLLPEIAAAFERLKRQQEATVDVTVETAFELNSDQEAKLAESLKAKLNCKINLHSEVNKALIGGVLVRAGDLVIDASVRGRLNKLVESLGA